MHKQLMPCKLALAYPLQQLANCFISVLVDEVEMRLVELSPLRMANRYAFEGRRLHDKLTRIGSIV